MNEHREPRREAEVFEALRELCKRPGFTHALAFLCWRDRAVPYFNELTAEALLPTYSRDRLLRTELAVLIGLAAQQPLRLEPIDEAALGDYVQAADTLMAEIHEALVVPMREGMKAMFAGAETPNPLGEGEYLREAIFYAPESAYFFQFRDLAPLRYAHDEAWLAANKGFSIKQAATISRAIADIHHEQLEAAADRFIESHDPADLFPAFVISLETLVKRSGDSAAVVSAFVSAFHMRSDNRDYQAIDDFNEISAFPLFPLDADHFVVFDTVTLYQSIYESPIFWMRSDRHYQDAAVLHRGMFTETFARDRLAAVFGAGRVHANVQLLQGKRIVDEIDVLVVYGDRLIILQAKSKGLTIESRKGSNLSIRKDFQGAVAGAYEQALGAARHIVAGDVSLIRSDGTELKLAMPVQEIFPFCVIADHYPSLANQTRSLLKAQTTEIIREPFVMDVFLLDALTEMLTTPLRLLGYVKQRALVFERVLLDHELTALSFHLKGNLWLQPDVDIVAFQGDIAADLDAAMIVRRMGVPGDDTPEGILTRFRDTPYERLIQQLEQSENPVAIEIGFLLLTMGLKPIDGINRAIRALTAQARRDPRTHDFSLGLGGGGEGLTVQICDELLESRRKRLEAHCTLKKHQARSSKWFGISLDRDGVLRLALASNAPWQPSAELDAAVTALLGDQPAASFPSALASMKRLPKLGPNDPCPCGKPIKFKKCCMWKPRGSLVDS